jgi:peptidoglycan hydrolase CwlO-like protein
MRIDRKLVIGVSLGTLLFGAAGCGKEVKEENERLKGQVSAITKERDDAKAAVTKMQADLDAAKKEAEEAKKMLEEEKAKMAAKAPAKK